VVALATLPVVVEGHLWEKVFLIIEIIEIFDDEKFLVMLFTTPQVSATAAMALMFILTVVVSLAVAVLSGCLPLVGASLHMLHHLVKLGWEEKMDGRADHEDEGEDSDAARAPSVLSLPLLEIGLLGGDTLSAKVLFLILHRIVLNGNDSSVLLRLLNAGILRSEGVVGRGAVRDGHLFV